MFLDPKGTSSSGSLLLPSDADVVQQWCPLHLLQIKTSKLVWHWFFCMGITQSRGISLSGWEYTTKGLKVRRILRPDFPELGRRAQLSGEQPIPHHRLCRHRKPLDLMREQLLIHWLPANTWLDTPPETQQDELFRGKLRIRGIFIGILGRWLGEWPMCDHSQPLQV